MQIQPGRQGAEYGKIHQPIQPDNNEASEVIEDLRAQSSERQCSFEKLDRNAITAAVSSSMESRDGLNISVTPPPVVSGPVGAALGRQLRDLMERNVSFMQKKSIHLPFTSPFRQLNAQEMERALTEGDEKKRAQLSVSLDYGRQIQTSSTDDIKELSSFLGIEASGTPADIKTAEFLTRARSEGFTVTDGKGEEIHVFEAYRGLVNPERAGGIPESGFPLTYKGLNVASLTAEWIHDQEKLGTLMSSAKTALEAFPGNLSLAQQAVYPAGSSTVEQRIETLKSLITTFRSGSDVLREYGRMRELAEKGAELTALEAAYSELQKALSSSATSSKGSSSAPAVSSSEALNLLASNLKSNPEICRSFISMAAKGTDIHTLCVIHDGLPHPVEKSDFERTVSFFSKDEFCTPERIGIVMQPSGDIPIADRVSTLKQLLPYMSWGTQNRTADDCMRGDYTRLTELAPDRKAFSALSAQYFKILDTLKAAQDNYWKDENRAALDFTAAELKDDPERFACFISLLSSRMPVQNAIEIIRSLPPFSRKADYEKMGSLIKSMRKSYSWGETGKNPDLNSDDCVKRDIERLSALASQADELPKLTALYVDILNAFPESSSKYWYDDYGELRDYAAAKLKDDPERFSCLCSLVQSGMSASKAQEVMESLPAFSNKADYEKMGSLIKSMRKSYSWGETGKNPDLNSDDCVKRDLERLSTLAYQADELPKLTALYVDILNAYPESSSKYWYEDYGVLRDYAATKLKDDPERFSCLLSLVQSGMSASEAQEVMESLPAFSNKADYEKMGSLIKSMRRSCSWGETGKNPNLNSDQCVKRDLDRLSSLASQADELPKLTALYVDILNAYPESSSKYWYSDYGELRDYAAAKLKDDPERFSCLCSLVQSGMSASEAIGIMESLPSFTRRSDYRTMGTLMKTMRTAYSWGETGNGKNLNSDECVKRDLEHISRLASSPDEIPELAGLYVDILKAYPESTSKYWLSDYSAILDYAVTKAKGTPHRTECLIPIVQSGMTAETMTQIMDMIPSFSKAESYGEMGKLLKAMRLTYPWGETGNQKSLNGEECVRRDLEALIRLPAEAEELPFLTSLYVDYIGSCRDGSTKYWEKDFQTALDFMGSHLKENPSAIPLFLLTARMKGTTAALDEKSSESYSRLAETMGTKESLQISTRRMNLLAEAFGSAGKGKKDADRILSDCRDACLWIADEFKKGTFEGSTPLEITSSLCEAVIPGASLEEAKRSLLFKNTPGEGIEVAEDADAITIGGVRLDVKNHRK